MQITSIDARGNVLQRLCAGSSTSGHKETRSYDPATGRLLSSQVTLVTGTLMQDLTDTWDVLGNLITRKDTSRKPDGTYRNLTETFTYDAANRLTRSSGIPGRPDLTLAYNGLGNITNKSDVGAYVYGSSRPHAVTTAGGTSYTYDSNGSLVSDGSGRSMTYTAANQLGSATKAADATSFEYDGNRNRFRRVDLSGSQTTTTLYVGGLEIITLPTGVVETKRYVGDAVLTTRSNATSQEAYVLRDHLIHDQVR